MARKNVDKGNAVLAVLELSTGYEVPIEMRGFKLDGFDHLTKALIGEIVFPAIKQHGHKKAFEVLASEILDCVEKLSEKQKTALLGAFIWKSVTKKWDELEEAARKQSDSTGAITARRKQRSASPANRRRKAP